MGLFVSNAVVCNSLNTLKSLPRFVHKKKLFLIYNGVDFNKTHRSNVPKDSNQFVVGTACRFVEQKDLETLLRGFHKFISKNEESDAILLLIGDGPKMPNLVDLSVRLKIQEKIIFKGEMSRSEVYKELQQLDVFVVSSIYEGFCNAMVEAAGTGLAIVATDIEPLPEVIGRENACFFRVGDSQALANIIDELQENPHHRAELGRLAEKYVISRYSLEKSSQKYFELYKDFLNEQS
jgi:glycosyltransferase involved in cell wall biosynthesis